MWQFVLTNLSHSTIGEVLNAYDRKVSLQLNRLDTCSFRVRLDNPISNELASTAGYIKAYRNGELLFYGPIITAEEVGDHDVASMAVTAVSPGWVFAHRIVGKSASGTAFSVLTDRAAIAESLIEIANIEDDTGVRISGSSSGSNITYTAGPYKMLSDTINELGMTLDGFDWRILPTEPVAYAAGRVGIGLFTGAPLIGTEQPNAVFEWGVGTRTNVVSYRRVVSRETQANRAYCIAPNGPDLFGYPVVNALDTVSRDTWGLVEDIVQADIEPQKLRQSLVNEHVAVRRFPRQTIEFQPHLDPQNTGRVPMFGTDYDVGDRVRARVMYNDAVRLDAMTRVWTAAFDIDVNGLETTTLTLSEE